MKTFLTLSIAALLFGFTLTTAQQNDFILKTDKDTISVLAGETAIFNVNVSVQNGFDGSISLKVGAGNLQAEKNLSTTISNAPYTGIKLTIKTTAAFTKNGFYGIGIEGTNGNLSSTAVCYLKVMTTPSQWHLVPMGFFMPGFIVQDGQGSYWHNLYESDDRTSLLIKQSNNASIETWTSARKGMGVIMSIPPVIDNQSGRIWLATINDGIMRQTLDNKNVATYTINNSPIPSNDVMDIAIDHDGNAWIATTKGLARLAGTEWTIFDSTNSVLNQEPITCLGVSGSIIWVGTTKGLAKYDGNQWLRITPQNSTMPAPYVWRMAVESNGDLWMGLGDSSKKFWGWGPSSMIGITKFDGTNWNIYDNKTFSLTGYNNYVSSISIDKKGNKWFSTGFQQEEYPIANVGSGIVKFDNTTWTIFSTANSPLPDSNINWVGVDNNDNVWFRQFYYNSNKSFWGVFNETGLPPFLAPNAVSEQPAESDGIHLFPNPTSTQFTLSGVEGVASVRVVNSLGEEVKQFAHVSSEYSIDVSDLVSGLYFVSIRTAKGAVVKPMMVSH